ncbi:hypothetical protein FQZ97_902150 [compost metagenome]
MRGLGEEVQDALDRLVGVVGVQRRDAQVAGFGVGHGVLHGVAVADLADHDHVGRFAHGVAQGLVERLRVQAHLALVHDGQTMAVLELHRVFDGEDVPAQVAVAVVQHGRQRGRLARARGTHHQHQTALELGQLFQHRRQLQPVQRRNPGVDVADHHGHVAALAVDVDPEAPQAGQGDGQVAFERGFKAADLRLAHHGIGQALRARRVQRRFRQTPHHALHLERGRAAAGEKEIRRTVRDHQRQVVAEIVVVGGQGGVHGGP